MRKLRITTLLVYTTIGILLGLWLVNNIIISFPVIQKLENDLSTLWYILERLIVLIFGGAFFILIDKITNERAKLTKWMLVLGIIFVLLPFRISVDMGFDSEDDDVVEQVAGGDAVR
jgi:hypothetical protein